MTDILQKTGAEDGGLWSFVRNRLKPGLQYVRWVCGVGEQVCGGGDEVAAKRRKEGRKWESLFEDLFCVFCD